MNKKIAFVMILGLIACGGPSDGDVNAAINGIKGVYSGLFEVLEQNKSNPEQAIAEGEKFVESKKDDLTKFGKVLGGGIKASQMERVQAFQEEIQTMSRSAGQRLAGSFAGNPGAKQKLGALMEKLGNYYVAGAQAEEGSGIKGRLGRAALKKGIMLGASQMKDTPEPAREQLLDGFVKQLADAGADQAEQDEFRQELKSELGW